MARSCVTECTIWGACLRSPRETFQTQRTRPCVVRICTTLDRIRAENCQPTWKWRLVIAYNGTGYSGWQPSSVTIQQKVEDALAKFTRLSRDELKVVGAGRTDSGVHACGRAFHDADLLRRFAPRRISTERMCSRCWIP